MQLVVLGIGSNRKFNDMSPCQLLQAACVELSSILFKTSFSSVYKTKAMYVENQEDFYNMVALGYVNDEKDPFELLNQINSIEAKYGRERSKEIRFGPRSLDIDIELFGNKTISSARLTIPHERMKERQFVLIPLLEILTETADIRAKEKIEEYSKCLEKLQKTDKNSEDFPVQKLGTLQVVLGNADSGSEWNYSNKN